MAKTKQVGVRFDQDMLDVLKEEGIASSPQKALNFLTLFYLEHRNKDSVVELFANSSMFKKDVKNIFQKNVENKQIEGKNLIKENHEIPPMPVRGEGENAIDFAARKNEWKAKYC